MFQDCRLGLKEHNPESYGKQCRLSTEDAEKLISRCPKDWALGKIWDPDDLRNRKIGLCGPAAAVNWIKMMAAACGRDDIRPTADDAEAFYRGPMGWDGSMANDEGVVLLEMMAMWMIHPIANIKIDGFYVIGHMDAANLATGVTVCPLIVGATLTKACQSTDTWDSSAADPGNGIWGNHAFLYFSDSPGGGYGKTWGEPVWNTPGFRMARWNEVYLPVCRELMPHIDVETLIAVARKL